MNVDYLIVGAGLFGAVFAREMTDRGYSCLVVERRSHIAGNIYTEDVDGIQVHRYGAHIFHTSDKEVWDYMNRFAEFNHYINSPVAFYGDETYNLPFNMNTFSRMWNIRTPQEAKDIIRRQIEEAGISVPSNLEEQAISLVGTDVYEKLIKGYTQKQWGRECRELPAFIIKRLPLRFTYDNNYFNDRYQGIPVGGYTRLVERMLDGIEVRLDTDYFAVRDEIRAGSTIYTGPVDAYFGYSLGHLEYRSLRFETERLDCENYQGNAVVNYTAAEVPYTRIIEHKHFEFGTQPSTVITKEYSSEWKPGDEPYYPVNDEKNTALYQEYKKLAEQEENLVFGGRLGLYRYFDMDKVIRAALDCIKKMTDAKGLALLLAVSLLLSASLPCQPLYASAKPKKLTMNTKKILLKKGGKKKLKVSSVQPSGASRAVKYEVANRKVAVVSGGGTVKGKHIGITTIRVTSKKNSHLHVLVKVMVSKYVPNKVKLSEKKMTMYIGEQKKLKATVTPDQVPAKYKKGTWSSSDMEVAAVNSKGTCVARSTGVAEVTYQTYNGKTGTCKITVLPQAEPEPTPEETPRLRTPSAEPASDSGIDAASGPGIDAASGAGIDAASGSGIGAASGASVGAVSSLPEASETGASEAPAEDAGGAADGSGQDAAPAEDAGGTADGLGQDAAPAEDAGGTADAPGQDAEEAQMGEIIPPERDTEEAQMGEIIPSEQYEDAEDGLKPIPYQRMIRFISTRLKRVLKSP